MYIFVHIMHQQWEPVAGFITFYFLLIKYMIAQFYFLPNSKSIKDFIQNTFIINTYELCMQLYCDVPWLECNGKELGFGLVPLCF